MPKRTDLHPDPTNEPGPDPDNGSSNGGSTGDGSTGGTTSGGGTSTSGGAGGGAGVVRPGSFCSPQGATGVTAKGTPMICGPGSDGRNRWRAA
ncbi:hypothetical protein [Streptomyces sp. NPDC053048]|uniref:hypothetical protein n=1 Tax=Streptomyces sp. NPDC053048 TaxID=3365694 RepID=UPI0037CD6B68